MDCIVPGILQARILEWVAIPFSRGSSQPRDWTQVSHITSRFFLAEPQGKSKNTGVGCLSLLQQIFLTQELTWGLLHCRRILYQLSYEGIPYIIMPILLMGKLSHKLANWLAQGHMAKKWCGQEASIHSLAQELLTIVFYSPLKGTRA